MSEVQQLHRCTKFIGPRSQSGKKKDEDGQEGEEEEYPLNNLATSPMPTWLKCCNFRLFAGVGTGRIVAGN